MSQGSLTEQNLVRGLTNDPADPRKHLTSAKSNAVVGGVIYVPGYGAQMGLVVVRFMPGARMQIAGFLASYHQQPTATTSAFSRSHGCSDQFV
jgi:hypothetical protein